MFSQIQTKQPLTLLNINNKITCILHFKNIIYIYMFIIIFNMFLLFIKIHQINYFMSLNMQQKVK